MTNALSLEHAGRDLFPGRAFDALLFDMDGTLLTSIGASERVWGAWAAGYGLNARDFLPNSHGMRVIDVIDRLALPGVDPARETQRILEAELADFAGVEAIAGARDFLTALLPHRWAVITSAPRILAIRRLTVAGLPVPPVLVTGEDVEFGKPDPACFLMGAARLRIAPDRCVVFEDAPAGIHAGEAARCAVVVVTAAHSREVTTIHPTILDYRRLDIKAA